MGHQVVSHLRYTVAFVMRRRTAAAISMSQRGHSASGVSPHPIDVQEGEFSVAGSLLHRSSQEGHVRHRERWILELPISPRPWG